MAKKSSNDFANFLRSQGLRKRVAKAVSDLENGAGSARGNAEQFGRRVISDLRSAADEIEKRLGGGGGRETKAAAPRKRASTKRRASTKKRTSTTARGTTARKSSTKRASGAARKSSAAGSARRTTSSARKSTGRKTATRKGTARKSS